MEELDQMIILDEEDNEILFNVLFEFDIEEFERSYIVLIPNESDETSEQEEDSTALYVFIIEENEEAPDEPFLYDVENEREWELIEEVINTFSEPDSEFESNN